MIALAQYNAFLMRGRHGAADAVEAAKNQVPLILCKPNRPMDRGRNGARYFRNPPQPHMCIQDFIEDTNEPCFINVLSWQKISTPRRPEDPIPLYGGMRVPHNSSAAMSLSSHYGAKAQPVIFAVMANPDILRLSGKTAQDPSDRDALVELMIDFVEAMNPDVRFKREFIVLKDRDLAGELKDIWLAVQAKRERERGENGRRESEKFRENRDEQWREEVRQRTLQNVNHEEERNALSPPAHSEDRQHIEMALQGEQEYGSYQVKKSEISAVEELYYRSKEISSFMSLTTAVSADLSITPSTETLNRNTQNIGATNYEEDSVYPLIRSHYEQELSRTENNTLNALVSSGEPSDQKFPTVNLSTCFPSTKCKQSTENVTFPVFSECVGKEVSSTLEDVSITDAVDDMNVSRVTNQQDQNYFSTNIHQETNPIINKSPTKDQNFSSCKSPFLPVRGASYEADSNLQEKGTTSTLAKSCKNSNSVTIEHVTPPVGDEHIFSAYTQETMFLNNKAQVPNPAGQSHEDLLPVLGDSTGALFPIGSDQGAVAMP